MQVPIPLMKLCFLPIVLASANHSFAVSIAAKNKINFKLQRFLILFDTNKDQTVDWKEFEKAANNRFLLIDKNKDQQIDQSELLAYLQARHKHYKLQMLKLIDENQDQKISLQEFIDFKKHRATKLFQHIDEDQNGYLDNKELTAFISKPITVYFSLKLFNSLDVNKDKIITREESLQFWTRWFKQLDRNNDQKVNKLDE